MKFRHDIQALRGYAVLLILLFHAEIGPFKAGYLGVDIFFVISGFLITGLIVKGLDGGDFSFKNFYYRRAKRLLPAAYVVLLFTTIASYFFLTSVDYSDYLKQLLGALTFTANIALYNQTEYFDGAAATKPLLHMWSLSIEEQFYMALPLTLFFLPKRFWKGGAIAAVLVSLGLCALRIENHPDSTFYMLPMRAWELGLGSLGAIFILGEKTQKYIQLLYWPSLAALVILPVLPMMPIHPGPDALLICLATLIIIKRQADYTGILPVIGPFAKLGDYSYSLYLVHWPLFAFATNSYLSDVPFFTRASLLATSLVLAIGLHHTIEKPIHYRQFKNRIPLIIAFFAGPVIIIGLAFLIGLTYEGGRDYKQLRRANTGLNDVCDQYQDYERKKECQTSAAPEILIWGDSYAMHLVEGISTEAQNGILQATRSSCGPFLDTSFYDYPEKPKNWAKQCILFNDSVFETLKNTPSIKTVILASTFGKLGASGPGLKKNGETFDDIIYTPDVGLEFMRATVKAIRQAGKKVVVISPPPGSNFNIGNCMERYEAQKMIFGSEDGCNVRIDKHGLTADVESILQDFPSKADVDVIYLSDYLCENNICKTTINGKWVYRDTHHLTYEGSKELFNKYDILQQIYNKAR